MARQRDVAGLPAGRRVDQGERAGIADQDLIGLGIDPDIVGIFAEPHAVQRREIGALEPMEDAVAAVGDEDRVGGLVVGNALRLLQPRDPAKDLALVEIDDTEAAVAEFGDEEPMAREIDRQMIDPAVDVTEGDLVLKTSAPPV